MIKQDTGQQVKWKVEFRIKRFPKSLAKLTSFPFIFSPNFTYQFDFDYRAQNFLIRHSATQHIYMKIPRDLIDTTWNGMGGEKAIQMIASRFKWISEDSFRIINESNMDCIFEICSSEESAISAEASLDADQAAAERRYLKLVSCVKLDNRFENQKKLDARHFICEPTTL